MHCQSSACRRVLALEAPARMFEEKTSKRKTYTNPPVQTVREQTFAVMFSLTPSAATETVICGRKAGTFSPHGMANLQRKNSGIDHSRTKRAPDFRIQSARVPDANKMPRDPVSSAGPFLSQGNSLRTASRMSPFVVASRTPGDHC